MRILSRWLCKKVMVLALFMLMVGFVSFAQETDAVQGMRADEVPVQTTATRHEIFSYEAEKLIRRLPEGTHLVVISGAMDTYMLGNIRDAIRANPQAAISLDLSAVSALFELHKEALNDCKNLVSLVIPDGLVRLQWQCFTGCDNLTAINATDGNEHFSSARGILYDKTGAELVVCPRAWNGTVTIPLSVARIRSGAFANCPNVTDFALETRTETYQENGEQKERVIENDTFTVRDGILYTKDMARLVQFPAGKSGRISIPGTVQVIGRESFAYCARVTAVEIPPSVRTIETLAFSYCASLHSVMIPESVTSIGKQSFLWCTSLGNVTIPASVTYLGSRSFFKSSVTAVTFADTDGWTYGKKVLANLGNPHVNAENFTHPGQYWFLDLYKAEE